MIKQHVHITKVSDGKTSLGRSNIQSTPTVDGGSPPSGLVFDLENGMVEWSNQNKLGDPGPYKFEYDYDDTVPSAYEDKRALHVGDNVSTMNMADWRKLVSLNLGITDENGDII